MDGQAHSAPRPPARRRRTARRAVAPVPPFSSPAPSSPARPFALPARAAEAELVLLADADDADLDPVLAEALSVARELARRSIAENTESAENVNSNWPHRDHLIWPHQVDPGQSQEGGREARDRTIGRRGPADRLCEPVLRVHGLGADPRLGGLAATGSSPPPRSGGQSASGSAVRSASTGSR